MKKGKNLSPLTILLIVIIFLMGTWIIRDLIKDNNDKLTDPETGFSLDDSLNIQKNNEEPDETNQNGDEDRMEFLNCIIEIMKDREFSSSSEERTAYDMAKDICSIGTGYKE